MYTCRIVSYESEEDMRHNTNSFLEDIWNGNTFKEIFKCAYADARDSFKSNSYYVYRISGPVGLLCTIRTYSNFIRLARPIRPFNAVNIKIRNN